MTLEQSVSFKLGEEVGYYGNVGQVHEHYAKKDCYGIVIRVAQEDTEISKKQKAKDYLITDASAVLRKTNGKWVNKEK